MSKKRPSAFLRRPTQHARCSEPCRVPGAEEREAACRGRRGGGSASPTNKETQRLSKNCSDAEFAVLVPIIEHAGAQSILLTKRPDSLLQYSGHVAFPGGARDPCDASLVATAIREAGEEVGIDAHRIKVISELPFQTTGIGHRVKPFVARVAPGPIVPNPSEVERVFYLPLSIFELDPFVERTWTDPAGKTRSTHTFRYEGHEIWGLTARILRLCFVEGIPGLDHSP